jgi:cytoskeleton protein RodZ
MLTTFPARARVKLDGTSIGAANYLGPIQLPAGEHTLRIEAAGYEPYETVLRVDSPVAQDLEVRLRPLAPAPKPATPR